MDAVLPLSTWLGVLAVGCLSGAAGALWSLTLSFDPAKMSGQTILALVISGYAGADFIEAFMSKRVAPVTPHE